jgi:hypothetical protein
MSFTRTQLSFIDRKRSDREASLAESPQAGRFFQMIRSGAEKSLQAEREEHCRVTLTGSYASELLSNDHEYHTVNTGVVKWRNTLMDLFIMNGWDARGR